jgi:ABC-type sulfate/molybdate transport systems ATPase subunit
VLVVDTLSVHRGTFRLEKISLRVPPGRTLAVLGPNGAGKSTLLETIAGLLPATAGRIAIGGVDCTDLAPERRRVGYLVQDYALFPHLSVRDNVRFGMTAARRRERFDDELLERLRIAPFADRRPMQLSGGERQRVALARALATDARALLFDEPFAALDVTLRPAVRADLRALLADLGVPSLFVTHDQAEARAIAHDVAIMRDGRIAQAGPVDEVFDAPADPFVAAFLGVENRWPGRIESVAGETATVLLDEGGRRIAATPATLPIGTRVLACVRGEDVHVEIADAEPIDGLRVRSVTLAEPGPFATLTLDCGIPVVAYVGKRDAAAVVKAPLERLRVRIAAGAVRVIALP